MSYGSTQDPRPSGIGGSFYADEKYIVRNPRQIRNLLQALIDQRSLITAHPEGREISFPTAILELSQDEDQLVLDGSPIPSINHSAEQATYLLCFAKLDHVTIRFRLEGLARDTSGSHISFRVALPEELYHLQRRELYRLETPVADSPYCLLPAQDERSEPTNWRVIDISGGGIALLLPEGQPLLSIQRRYGGCQLQIPEAPLIPIALVVCNIREYRHPNGAEMQRIGLQFDDLPRGADVVIQRYIFRIDRERKARINGEM